MKQNANLTGIGQQLSETTQSYVSAPLITAPNSNIRQLSGATRQLPDPSKSLRPAMGIERIQIRSIVLKQDEVGSNGEPVWEPDSKDARIRLAGTWETRSDTYGSRAFSSTVNSYTEITFYGTGLNILLGADTLSTRDFRVTIDGGAEGSNFFTQSYSAIIHNRNYASNCVFNIASNLSLGVHTVRVRLAADNIYFYGFEILNTSSTTNIVVPKGSVIANGNKYNLTNDSSLAYATGFDGNPSLNGRGGKVVVYLKDGQLRKVIQQAGNQLNLSSANHADEELIRRIHYKEFGANRADDFSTLAGVTSDRAFTLDDGTTTLVADDVQDSGPRGLEMRTQGTSFITLTFVGTGLDVIRQDDTASVNPMNAYVDGTLIGALPTSGFLSARRQTIVSGLPYGTHVVRIDQPAGSFVGRASFSEFIIYGPKTPAIPDGAVKVGEYNLMANFVANAAIGVDRVSTGTLRKVSLREMVYVNGTGGTSDWSTGLDVVNKIGGWNLATDRNNAYFEYSFYGTGFDFRFNGQTSHTPAATVSINGTTLTATNFPTAAFSTYGSGISFNSATGSLDQQASSSQPASGFVVSGLPLGRYTVRVTNNTASSFFILDSLDIITPIHIAAGKTGSMSIADLPLINESAKKPTLDLSKAKVWLRYDGVNQRILSSYNVAAVLKVTTGEYRVYFEKPFKNTNYAISGSINESAATNAYLFQTRNGSQAHSVLIKLHTYLGAGADEVCSLACFGELQDE